MDAELRGNQTAHLTLFKGLNGGFVIGDELARVVPTHIAILLGRDGVGGIFLHRIHEIELAGVDLVEHFLSRRLVGGIEQDVRGTLGAVIGRGVHLRVLQHVGFARVFLGCERSVQLVLLELLLDFGAVALLGHAGLLKSGLPLLVGVEVVLHALDGLVDLGAFNRDALFLNGFLHQLALSERIDHFVTHRCGRVIVLGKPRAPGFLVACAQLVAHALDVVRDGVLGNVHSVDGARHAAGTRRSIGTARTGGKAPCARGRQAHGTHGLHDVRFLHMTLPSNMNIATTPLATRSMR